MVHCTAVAADCTDYTDCMTDHTVAVVAERTADTAEAHHTADTAVVQHTAEASCTGYTDLCNRYYSDC